MFLVYGYKTAYLKETAIIYLQEDSEFSSGPDKTEQASNFG